MVLARAMRRHASARASVQKTKHLHTHFALAQSVPSAANIRRYAEIVRERAIMRKLAEVGTAIADSAYSPGGREARQLLDEAETKILEIGESGSRSSESFAKMSQVLAEVMA